MKKIQLSLIAVATLFTSASAFIPKAGFTYIYYPTGITTYGDYYMIQTSALSCFGIPNVACKVTTLYPAWNPGTGLQVPKAVVHTVQKRGSFF